MTTTNTNETKSWKEAPVTFKGIQPGFGPFGPMALFNTTAAFELTSKIGTTLSLATLQKASFYAPQAEMNKARAAMGEFEAMMAERKAGSQQPAELSISAL